MLKYIFTGITLLHGLIHLAGFAKAFQYAAISALKEPITRTAGTGWLVAALLFIIAVFLFLSGKQLWAFIAVPAAALSQLLIISAWQDARFGTVANIVIVAVAIAAIAGWRFEQGFRKDVFLARSTWNQDVPQLLTEKDIEGLPLPVQQYLRYSGALNKPRPCSMHIVFEGQMRSRGKDWFPFRTEQYNFFAQPSRFFFMKGKMHGIQVPGYHCYRNGQASMQIRLFGFWPVVNMKGGPLNKGELVTWFNDLCLFAPAALADNRICWEAADEHSSRAIFTTGDISISATLQFSDKGQLINFISDDRYEVDDKKCYRFSTPLMKYASVSGMLLSTYGEAVWHYPEGDFAYGRFWLKKLEYDTE